MLICLFGALVCMVEDGYVGHDLIWRYDFNVFSMLIGWSLMAIKRGT